MPGRMSGAMHAAITQMLGPGWDKLKPGEMFDRAMDRGYMVSDVARQFGVAGRSLSRALRGVGCPPLPPVPAPKGRFGHERLATTPWPRFVPGQSVTVAHEGEPEFAAVVVSNSPLHGSDGKIIGGGAEVNRDGKFAGWYPARSIIIT